MLCRDIEPNVQDLIPVIAPQFITGPLTAAHKFSKVSLLKAYNAIDTYHILCLPEAYLNHYTLFDNANLRMPWYKLIKDSTALK